MNAVFADAAYWVGLLNEQDSNHQLATALNNYLDDKTIFTSEMVLTETLNSLAKPNPKIKECAQKYVTQLIEEQACQIIEQTHQQFEEAFAVYKSYRDKKWGLTDCASFRIMKTYGIVEVLTTDRHFEQMGFAILMKASD